MSDAFASMGAIELIDGYRCRAFSPVEVVTELLARTEVLNAQLNAFYLIDSQGALASARESEARWADGCPCGILDGVPSSIKDALASKGAPSYRGSAAHAAENQDWVIDSPVVARMREAGAIFLGKTTMPDFGILASGTSSKHGITRNPWDMTRTPGGSSSGTAASIAAGLNPIAVGTDIVGSIRLPASFCGLVGLKPSQGRVPYYFPNSPSLVAGPMARTVVDAALLMNVITRPDPRDFTALPPEHTDYVLGLEERIGGATLGFVESLGFGLEADPEVLSLIGDAVDLFRREGFTVRRKSIFFSPEELRVAELFYKVRCRTEFLSMPKERQRDAAVISDWSAEAERLTAPEFYRIFTTLQSMRERTARLIEDVDFLVLPSVHIPAFEAALPSPAPDQIFAPWANSFLFNLTEQPASSLPCGRTSSGLPVGLQIVGHRYDDLGVLRLSMHFERICPMTDDLKRLISGLQF